MTKEYRISVSSRRHPDIRHIVEVLSDDEPMWQEWNGAEHFDEDDDPRIKSLRGTAGLAKATAIDQERDGEQDVRIEVREVSPWEQVYP